MTEGDLPIERDTAEEADRVALLASALRADQGDLATYERVLTTSLADALPAGIIEVERDRSLSDRMAGRPGSIRALRIHLGEETLELQSQRGGLRASMQKSVRGVAISRKELSLDAWSDALARALARFAEESEGARKALERLLGIGGG